MPNAFRLPETALLVHRRDILARHPSTATSIIVQKECDMPPRNARWVLLTLLFAVFPALAQRPTETFQGHQVAANQVLVKFGSAHSPNRAQAEWAEDTDRSETINLEGVVRIHSRNKSAASLVSDLMRRSDVVFAEPDYVVHAISAPNDPGYGQLWAMKNTGQAILGYQGTGGADIGAEAAWNVTTGTSNVVVGVVDTGIDYNHPDLGSLCTSSASPA